MSVKEKQVNLTATADEYQTTSGGVSEWLERGDHPLLNDLILETFFGFVRRFDLKACRVVCKKWNVRTLPHMRTTFKVKIYGTQSSAFARTILHTHGARGIQNFVQLFSSNELGIPFGKFRLGPFRSTEGVGEKFLQLCGEIATEIDLDEGESYDYIIEDVSELLRSSPNLQILALPFNIISRSGNVVKLFPNSIPTFSSMKKIIFRPDEKKRLKVCPTFIEELIAAAPNILDISVSNTIDENEEENSIEEEGTSQIRLVLSVIEKLGMESSIQTLVLVDAEIGMFEEHLERMAKNGLKLKCLSLDPNLFRGDNDNDRNSNRIKLATTFKDTLEYLNVDECVDNILMEFPNMPKLKSLTLKVYPDIDPKPVNLNNNFPTLQALHIGFVDTIEEDCDWTQFFSKFESCPTLKSLSVDNYGNVMQIHTFHNIMRIFPNLNKLSLNVEEDGVEILRQIWTQMTQLESLTIRGDIVRKDKDYLDSLFTGIPIQALIGLTHVVNSLDRMTVQDRRERILKVTTQNSQMPSIRNLTKLKHLDLRVSGGETCQHWSKRRETHFHLTDLTAYLALYSMKHLHHFIVKQCHFTEAACEILTKETGLEIWSFQNEGLEDIVPPFDLYLMNEIQIY